MNLRTPLSAFAVVAVCAALSLGAAGPASAAVTPGSGAVIFNADGTPIGSELTYGPDAVPQFVFTSDTRDDDAWGLLDGSPAHEDDATGIPLGFSVTVQGSTFDQVFMSSNGSLCLTSPTTAVSVFDNCAYTYYLGVAGVGAAAADEDPADDFAAFLPLNVDQFPPSASTPVDADDNSVPESCTFGSYLFESAGEYYCSSIFWGSTTYEGKAAFAATWYHDPDIEADDDEFDRYNTYQVILVDNGGGDITVVYNYDETNNSGSTVSELAGSNDALEAACDTDPEDPTLYSAIGYTSYDATTTAFSNLDLYGPACLGGLNPTPTAELMTGGASQLSLNSLNSTVAGRYAFALIAGLPTLTLPAVVVDPVVVVPAAAAPAAQLAATGADAESAIAFGSMLLAAGIAILVWRRTRTIAE